MLLILGDAGCGKTTVLKYYAMLCLKEDRYRMLGFRKAPLPV
jgi:ABC-type lipoprotein export system ATPase subunit